MNSKYILIASFIGILFLSACSASTPAPAQTVLPTSVVPSQTPPKTATATLTSTPVPTASEVPTVIPMYFSEEFNTDLNAWESFQTGGTNPPIVNLENESLRIDFSTADTWFYAVHTAHEYSNVSISASVNGLSGSVGLVCNYSEENGWYEFNIASDRTYSILFGQRLADGVAKYVPIANGAADILESGSLNYEIGLMCDENNLKAFINGILFRSPDITRYDLSGGKIGVTASSYKEIPAIILFNWVKVSEQ